ncbi:hypothetical protein [Erythrobacter sp. CCH5-A1]|uniref:hypothetical protein n=1 Tax=Erythrobacter sp. CCH5-A1 TaxID=1768792 RepID=UPI00083628D6|nr:hypothetical protein [Erythrobacter sp. CCH5-A1]
MACALTLLVLSACGGWTAHRQLIPEEQRDNIGLSGTYQSSERFLEITPLGDNLYRITNETIGSEAVDKPVVAAFDLIRSERSGDDQDGYSYENTYLMEVRQTDDEGNVTYVYEIVSSFYSDQNRNPTFTQFQVNCSKAAAEIATGDEYGCLFADYGEVRRAAADALAWAEDPRMALHQEAFSRYQP